MAVTNYNWCSNSPDKFPTISLPLDLSSACRNHDICYATFSYDDTSKPTCDKNLYYDIVQACQNTFTESGSLDLCYKVAQTYYFAVNNAGQGPYDRAQNNAEQIAKNLNRFGNGADFYERVALEMSERNGRGELDEDIVLVRNVTATIAMTMIGDYNLRLEDNDSSDYREGNCSISFAENGLIKYVCTINNTYSSSFEGLTRVEENGILRIIFPNGRADFEFLEDGSLRGLWLLDGTSTPGNIFLQPASDVF